MTSSVSKPEETAILIVGTGPAGLTLTAELARRGTKAITISRHRGTAHTPRAHITNQRSMEAFRDLDMEQAVREIATPNALMGNNVWATSFAGEELARLHSWGVGPEWRNEYDTASPCAMCNAPQHVLEPVILHRARELGADIRFSHELVSINQDNEGVVAIVRNRKTEQTHEIHAKYAIGCDGGRSTVAEQAGISLQGEANLGAALNIWLEADLTQYCQHRPSTLYWMIRPGNDYWVGSGTWICVKPFTEWVNLSMYDPTEGEPDTSDEAILARVRATLGDDAVKVHIKDVSKWQMCGLIAETYRVGRIFIAGDAAHRHPPANGLGSNTSIQDSANLGWKLDLVLRGLAGEALLDSYDDERRPVGHRIVDRAVKSVENMAPIPHAIGFAPGQTEAEGWEALNELSAPTPEGARKREEFDAAIRLQNYQFNAHGVELDQRYASKAVIDDGTAWPSDPDSGESQLHYEPTTHPGAPLPHAWIKRDKAMVSTLDLVGHGRFTLLTGLNDAAWRGAAQSASASTGIELAVECVDTFADNADVFRNWRQLRETGENGALLVRPDRIIAWRTAAIPNDPAATLTDVLQKILAQSGSSHTESGPTHTGKSKPAAGTARI